MSEKILVVAAHPDDEVLGVGATLNKHVLAGDTVEVVFMSGGVDARDHVEADAQEARLTAAEKALGILGVTTHHCLDFSDNRMDSYALLDLVKPLEKLIAQFQPSHVYTHFAGDLNIDHELTTRAVLTACRPLPNSPIKAIYSFEVLSSTGWQPSKTAFTPNHYVDVDAHWQAKLDAVDAYKNEMRAAPHARSLNAIDALARHRGNHVGVHRAEAFQILFSLS